MPPSVLFGLQKSADSASQGTAATRTGAHSIGLNNPGGRRRKQDIDGLPKMASAAQISKNGNLDRANATKSRQSHRTTTHAGQLSVRNKLPQ